MGTSIRELIIKDAVTQAAKILTASGYNTDLGTDVSRIKTFDEDTTQALVIVARNETSEKIKFGKMSHTMPLDLNAFKQIGSSNIATVGEEIYADLIKVMTDPADKFSTYIDSITHTGGGPTPLPSNEDVAAAVVATFEIKYKTVLGDPGAQ